MDECYEIFQCRIRLADGNECGWEGNRDSRNPNVLWEYAEGYAIAYQKHTMRHLLPTHFPPCRRNRNEWTAEYWREQNEWWGVKLGGAKTHPPKGRLMAKPLGAIERFKQEWEAEIQKAILANCTSIEKAEKAWKAYVAADWEAHRAKGNGYVWLRNSDGRKFPFGPDGHPCMEQK